MRWVKLWPYPCQERLPTENAKCLTSTSRLATRDPLGQEASNEGEVEGGDRGSDSQEILDDMRCFQNLLAETARRSEARKAP